MNEPKTPNLGLNKIDRSSPSTTYFDLDKYLDQNWEKVDEGVGQVGEKAEETAAQVSSIQERLDTEKRRSVTLEPGLQVINAKRASAFKLEGLKGRTLVNLLGRVGGMENITGLSKSYTTLALDSANKTSGVNGLKITNLEGASTSSAGLAYTPVIGLKSGSYYVLISDAKNLDAEFGLQIGFGGSFGGPYSSAVKHTDKFGTIWTKKQISTVTAGNVDLAVVGSVGESGFFDSVRLYEISAAEYNALDSMTPEQVAAKYPYVVSAQPVRNPYAIRYGENLLPPFMDMGNITGTTKVINSLYDATINNPSNGDDIQYHFNCSEGNVFTLSVEHTGRIGVNAWDINNNAIGFDSLVPYTSSQSVTFTMPAGTVKASIHFGNIASEGQYLATCSFKNPMLTLGNVAKPFKPREDVMLALQTDLYADPLTGTNADEVFEKDGQCFKLAKWKRLALDSNYSYDFYNSYTGGKCVRLVRDIVDRNKNVLPIVTKYNGSYLSAGSPSIYVDQYSRGDWDTGANGAFLGIGVSSTDSGWGDSYTPTADEIKAYFMGWKMYTQNGSALGVYNGTGTKAWAYRFATGFEGFAGGTTSLPTTQAPITESWTPYQLVYQLATPTVEPITSEGQLTLIEGNNQVEVGTGLVVREGVKPVQYGEWAVVNYTYSGNHALLANKVDIVKGVFKDNKKISNYLITRAPSTSYGNEYIGIKWVEFDPTAKYTVTYFMLDKSPVAPFVGSVAENEKALLTDMNHILRQNAAAVSVVETTVNEAVRQLLQQQNKRNVWGAIE